MKFTPPGGQIAIRTYNDNAGHFRFEITDNGIGIERERLTSIFTPFEQADPTVSRQFGGLGLGLAISRHLIDLHHGRIEAESRGRSFGTTFKITLDTLPEGAEEASTDSASSKHVLKRLRILLVEDHRDTRHALVTPTDSLWPSNFRRRKHPTGIRNDGVATIRLGFM